MWSYELTDIALRYGELPALDIRELRIARERMTAVVGPNGAGKTSLLDVLAFLRTPDRGILRFLGAEARPGQLPALRRRVGYVQQKPYLFNTSVRRNLELALGWRRVAAAERRRRIDEAAARFGLERLLDRRAHALSGGEAQKVALARAVVLSPEVLLLDEPFTFLDRGFAGQMEEFLRGHCECRTVIFTTHDLALAERIADEVHALAEGRVAPFPTVNLFNGVAVGDLFDTGRVKIEIAGDGRVVRRIAVDSNQIVLSRQRLDSSMRNAFAGTVRAIAERGRQMQVTVEAGELFEVLVTRAAWEELGLGVGERAWISFKSTAVHLL
jgi:tungstate transport system ATP-binding protein